MADWKEQYLAALKARDEVEQAQKSLYDYCTRLADQKAALQNQAALAPAPNTATATERPESPSSTTIPPSLVGRGLRRVTSPPARPSSPTSLIQIRQDLASAQQERGDLQSRVDILTRDLETLRTKSTTDTKRIVQLTTLVSQLTVKIRDRDEELRGKAKLVENVQDENVALNLQLNMAEERLEGLKKENQDLVDRWMARMGREADRMNEESKFR